MASFVQSCSQKDDFLELSVRESEVSLNLIAPSGEKIASSISTLKEEVAEIVAERFAIDKDFSISGIEYLPLDKGYSANISYKTFDGIDGNLIKTKVSSVRLKSGADEAGGGIPTIITIACKRLGSCECRATAVISSNGVQHSCGNCLTCEMREVF